MIFNIKNVANAKNDFYHQKHSHILIILGLRYIEVNKDPKDAQQEFDATTTSHNHLYDKIKKVNEEKAKLQAEVNCKCTRGYDTYMM